MPVSSLSYFFPLEVAENSVTSIPSKYHKTNVRVHHCMYCCSNAHFPDVLSVLPLCRQIIYLSSWTVSDPPVAVLVEDAAGLQFLICEYGWWDHSLAAGQWMVGPSIYFRTWSSKRVSKRCLQSESPTCCKPDSTCKTNTKLRLFVQCIDVLSLARTCYFPILERTMGEGLQPPPMPFRP